MFNKIKTVSRIKLPTVFILLMNLYIQKIIN